MATILEAKHAAHKADVEIIHKALWQIETTAAKAGVSQFKSYVKAQKFLKRYARRLNRQYKLRQTKGWSEARLAKFANRWNVQSGISAIQYEVQRRDLLKSTKEIA